MTKHSAPEASAAEARLLLLDGQGLLEDPARRAGPRAVQNIVEQLGFVQVDSIQKVERAHHLILGSRLDGYRAAHLDDVAFRKRQLFEHWTHDASLIPIAMFPHWRHRFVRTEQRLRKSRWFTHRLGAEPEKTIAHVLDRIAKEGPLLTSAFERSVDKPATGWWDWTPEKAALEYLWHTGRLAIHGRDRFQKIYNLIEHTFPELHAAPVPSDVEHLEWACTSALSRLGFATSGEIGAYWAAIKPPEAAAWCRDAVAQGKIEVVTVTGNDGKVRKAFALPSWRKQVRRLSASDSRIRILAPFDPIVRDRKRAERLFGFDFRFEAFVPAPKRKYGYYVCPLLEGDRFVGRIELRFDRERSILDVEGLWWERGIKPNAERRRKLNDALHVLAVQIGAEKVSFRKANKL
jgi:uncharacterized protein YcaQ